MHGHNNPDLLSDHRDVDFPKVVVLFTNFCFGDVAICVGDMFNGRFKKQVWRLCGRLLGHVQCLLAVFVGRVAFPYHTVHLTR